MRSPAGGCISVLLLNWHRSGRNSTFAPIALQAPTFDLPPVAPRCLADGVSVRSYRVADFSDLADVVDDDHISALDVRQKAEFDKGQVRRAVNIPLHELLDRVDEVPTGEVWTYCGSGYRSSIAASIIDHPERTVVLIDDS